MRRLISPTRSSTIRISYHQPGGWVTSFKDTHSFSERRVVLVVTCYTSFGTILPKCRSRCWYFALPGIPSKKKFRMGQVLTSLSPSSIGIYGQLRRSRRWQQHVVVPPYTHVQVTSLTGTIFPSSDRHFVLSDDVGMGLQQ